MYAEIRDKNFNAVGPYLSRERCDWIETQRCGQFLIAFVQKIQSGPSGRGKPFVDMLKLELCFSIRSLYCGGPLMSTNCIQPPDWTLCIDDKFNIINQVFHMPLHLAFKPHRKLCSIVPIRPPEKPSPSLRKMRSARMRTRCASSRPSWTACPRWWRWSSRSPHTPPSPSRSRKRRSGGSS